ncbi:MAG: hypothetical protein M3Q29_10330 [Chloroflexota bacterium]|nr:hypothetical protein [Chloroflexota bacterium]
MATSGSIYEASDNSAIVIEANVHTLLLGRSTNGAKISPSSHGTYGYFWLGNAKATPATIAKNGKVRLRSGVARTIADIRVAGREMVTIVPLERKVTPNE